MSRTAIVLILLCALGAMSLGTYFLVFPRVAEIHLIETTKGLDTAGRLLQEMDVVDEGLLLGKAVELAARPGLRRLLEVRPAGQQARGAWLVKLRAEAAGLAAAARDVATVKDFFILDAAGVGLVRNIDLHWTGKAPSTHEVVKEALGRAIEGKQQTFIFEEQGQLSRAVAAPVTHKGKQLGIVLITFPFDDTLAKARGSELELDVDFAYLTRTGIPSKNLPEGAQKALQRHLETNPDILERLLAGKKLQGRTIETAGQRFLMVGVPVKARGGKGVCCLVLMRSAEDMDRPLQELGLYLFGGTGLLFLFLAVLTVLFGGRLTRSLKGLEQEIFDVVNAGKPRMVQAQGPAIVRSVANLLNQAFMGQAFDGHTAEMADQDEDRFAFEGFSALEDELGAGEEPAVEQEGEDAYFRELFDQFCKARQELGEDTSKLVFERFWDKLEAQAEKIKDVHGCLEVRFRVTIKEGKVNLLPRIVR